MTFTATTEDILRPNMSNILLINEKLSKMDLSAVKDAEGKMVILQPKGTKGSTRECHEDVLDHPHVTSMINAKWLSYRPIGLAPAASVPPPAPTAVAPPATRHTPAVTSTPPVPTPAPPAASEEAPPSASTEDTSATTEPAEAIDTGSADEDQASAFVSGTKKEKEKKGKRND